MQKPTSSQPSSTVAASAAAGGNTAARDLLIEQHRPYVRALAVEIKETLLSMPVELNEMIAYGQLGLVEAADRYDARRGVTFATFSYYRIRGAIFDGLREMGYYPRSAQARLRFAANDALRTAADDELAPDSPAHSVDDEIVAAQSTINALIPIFLLSLDSDAQAAAYVDARSARTSTSSKYEQHELAQLTRSFIAELPEDCRRVIEEVYFRDSSMTDLAAKMGVTRSWISRLHARALKHLRQSMEQRGLLDST